MINSNNLQAYLKKVANVIINEITLVSNSGPIMVSDRSRSQTLILSTEELNYEQYDTLNVHMNTAFDQYLKEAYSPNGFPYMAWVRYPDSSHNCFAHYALLPKASDINDPMVDPIAICLVTQTDTSIIIHFIDLARY